MRLIVVAVVTIIVLTSLSWSQAEKTNALFLHGGVSNASSPDNFSDYWRTGFNAGGGYEIALSHFAVLLFDIDYNGFPLDNDNILENAKSILNLNSDTGISIQGAKVSLFTFTGNVKIFLNRTPNTAMPYATAGLGCLKLSASNLKATVIRGGNTVSITQDFTSQTALCVSLGLGCDIPISDIITGFVDFKYFRGFTTGEKMSYFPIRLGIEFGF